MAGASSSAGITLDPPFRGYIETTFDALLVFEAAKRGMIPRVTRRLIERERSMVQSGAVFVFDEQESGIKRWTDGLTWSPSRILGNFLVYRETDKPSNGSSAPGASGTSSPSNTPAPPVRVSTTTAGMMGPPHDNALSTTPPSAYAPPLGQGALQRPRSVSEGGGQGIDRQRERQLVGSLTNSYKFKDSGLVKKTMSVTVNGYTQHMISYYNLEDVTAGRLRTPSTILELAALEISPDYLAKQNFRFPPQIEVGPDGIPRYRGELEEPGSPQTPASGTSAGFYLPPGEMPYDPYGGQSSAPPSAGPGMARYDHPPDMRHQRAPQMATPITIPGQHPHTHPHPPPPNHQYYQSPTTYYENGPQIQREGSGQGRAVRPSSAQARRYDPYGNTTSPRSTSGSMPLPSTHSRKASQPPPSLSSIQGAAPDYYPPPTSASSSSNFDIKPSSLPLMSPPNPFAYNPPPTAPSSFGGLYVPGQRGEPGAGAGAPMPQGNAMANHHGYQPSPPHAHTYPQWNSGAAGPGGAPQAGRLMPANQAPAGGQVIRAPGSAGSDSPGSMPAPGSAGTERGGGWPNPGPPAPAGTAGGGQQTPRSHHQPMPPGMPMPAMGQQAWDPRHPHPHAHAHAHPPPGQPQDARAQQQAYAVDQWQ